MLYLALDANFQMSRKGVSTKQRNPCLTRGREYFVEDEGFLAHLEAHQGKRQEVCGDFLGVISLRIKADILSLAQQLCLS
jgi:hypothetical protein